MSEYHHENSPSALARREFCPGSRLMESGKPDSESDASREGTMLHSVIASRLLGQTTTEKLTTEQQIIIEDCLDFVDLFCDGKQLIIEQKSRLIDEDTGELLTEGTADVVIINGNSAIVIDWKFGRGDVPEAVDNIQLATYALMVWQKYKADNIPITHITCIVYQPRAYPKLTEHTFTDFGAMYNNIRAVIRRTFVDNPPLITGLKQCQYCKGKETCPEYHNELATTHNEIRTINPVSLLTASQLSEMVDKTSLIVRYHEMIKAEIRTRLEQGDEVSGWQLRQGRTQRTADANELFTIVAKQLSADEFAGCCTVSVPKIEDAIMEKVKSEYKTKKAAKDYASRLIDCVVHKKPTQPILERVK